MRTKILVFGVVCGFLGLLALHGHAEKPEPTIRVGTYDNRAIAIAYAPSKYNPVPEKMKEYKSAKEAGDEERMKELEAWGEKQQRKLHRQGFGRVPVDDLLAHVNDRLPEVARSTGVDIIAWECNYVADNVEVVDVTTELVKLFDPSEKTLNFVKQLEGQPPVAPDKIEQDHEH